MIIIATVVNPVTNAIQGTVCEAEDFTHLGEVGVGHVGSEDRGASVVSAVASTTIISNNKYSTFGFMFLHAKFLYKE